MNTNGWVQCELKAALIGAFTTCSGPWFESGAIEASGVLGEGSRAQSDAS